MNYYRILPIAAVRNVRREDNDHCQGGTSVSGGRLSCHLAYRKGTRTDLKPKAGERLGLEEYLFYVDV